MVSFSLKHKELCGLEQHQDKQNHIKFSSSNSKKTKHTDEMNLNGTFFFLCQHIQNTVTQCRQYINDWDTLH